MILPVCVIFIFTISIPSGPVGINMALNYGYNRRHIVFGTTSKGPVGPQGPAGPSGPSGSSGSVGQTGPPGSDGARGQPGTPGAKGGTGSRGPKGKAGGLSAVSADLDMNTNKIVNVGAPTDDTDATTKEYVDYQTQSGVKHDRSTPMSSDLDMGSNKIVKLAEPTADMDASTKKYVDQGDALTKLAADAYALLEMGEKVSLDGSSVMTGNLNMGSNTIMNLPNPGSGPDGANKSYVDDKVNLGFTNGNAHTDRQIGGVLDLGGLRVMTGNLDTGGNKVVAVGAPTADTDASNKKYVDDSVAGGSVLEADGSLNMNFKKIGNLGAPTSADDAVTRKYLEDLAAKKLNTDGYYTMSGNLSMGSNKITGLGVPTGGTDASTKKYVDDTSTSAQVTAATNLASMGARKVSVDGTSVMSGGLDMGGNGITGLSDPSVDGDAANKKYVDSKSASGGGGIADTSKFVTFDRTIYKVVYAGGAYKSFLFTTSGYDAPYNGGYGTDLTVTTGDIARVPVVGEMASVHIEQNPDSSNKAEIRVTVVMPNVYWKAGETQGVVFAMRGAHKPRSNFTAKLTQSPSNSQILQDIKLLGNLGGYDIYLSRVIHDPSVTPLTLTFSFEFDSADRMVIDLYPGFVFDGIDLAKYTSSTTANSLHYPTHPMFDHHRFIDSTVGDVLIAGIQNPDGILTVEKLLITEKNVDTSPSSWFHTETGKSFVISLPFEGVYRGVQSYTLHRTTLPPSTKITLITMATEGSTTLQDKFVMEVGAKFYVGGGSSSLKKLTTFGKRQVNPSCEGISYLGMDVAISPPASCIAFELYLEQADFLSSELTKKVTMLVRVYSG